ncbi:DUF4199 domain-containing protein [Taibaiella koreensis]|uniref:DUF4199 domain-containing protein n=1 Tax=Taibaiella koreensis TaxID=1268548 RepID=UPI000E59ADE9|nr:DUF4199 domain-containing protein [Taibaiella koreensis]
MKKTVWISGSIAGLIVAAIMAISMMVYHNNPDMEGSMLLGYAGMLLAFSLIFVGVKQLRDKHYGGLISFGKAFKAGLFIALIASTIYVLAWLIIYYGFMPDYMDRYCDHMIRKAQQNGNAAELKKQMDEMAFYKEYYKNPLFVILFTYAEILPVGIVVSLICALLLKRKSRQLPVAS